MSEVYFGERMCQAAFKSGAPCTNKAYFVQEGSYRCGVHSKKTKRVQLAKNPRADELAEEQQQNREDIVKTAAAKKRKRHERGDMTCTKLRMMKPPVYLDGYRCVFPNFKHQGRKDGFGCMALSPKALGPIKHDMPGIPDAKNLENYHQGAKFWDFEFDETNELRPSSKRLRCKMYKDPKPYRHKWSKKELKEKARDYNKNVNIPKCSIYYTKDCEERRYSYLECRYFYCHWYERLAPTTDDFKALVKMRDEGISLNIVGYDGYVPDNPIDKNSLWTHYNDTSRPFGHELVLLTLLALDDPKDYPWNRFYREHPKLYEGVI